MARSSANTRALTDPEEIREWAEERGARPTCVKRTGGSDDVGIIRLDFPGYSGEDTLQEIDWDDWLQKFEDSNLALLVQDTTAGGERSNFNKLVGRDTLKRREQEGRATGSRRRSAESGRRAEGRRSSASRPSKTSSRGRRSSARGTSSREGTSRSRGSSRRRSSNRSASARSSRRRNQGSRSASRSSGTRNKTRTTGRAEATGKKSSSRSSSRAGSRRRAA